MFGHEKDKCCHSGMGVGLLLLGVAVILNSVYGWLSWPVFVGAVIAIKGLVIMAKPKK